MIVYIGYGFNTLDFSKADWVALYKRFDAASFAEYAKDKSEEDIESGILDEINENYLSPTDYLRDVICGSEYAESGIENVVSCYDGYIVFDSIRFADDSPRTNYIRNAQDFVKMINKYVSTENLTFGNLYEGNDWLAPEYFLD